MPIPTTISFIALIKNPKTRVTLLINLINPDNAAIIFGKFVTAQPTNNIPTKSRSLPKNPRVLFAKIVPFCFTAPESDTASISSSLSFLLTFSCLFLKKLLSLAINVLLKAFDSLVLLTISNAFFCADFKPLLNFAIESLIELRLIDDLSNEFLLALKDIRQTLQMLLQRMLYEYYHYQNQ